MSADIPVSVILPTYDRAAYLGRSIGSVLAQTYGDFELIVVDDGSRDATADVVGMFADPRVRYVRLPANRGLPAARNAGIAHARGALLAFQDSTTNGLAASSSARCASSTVIATLPSCTATCTACAPTGACSTTARRRSYAGGSSIEHALLADLHARDAARADAPRLPRARGAFDESLVAFEDLDLHLRVARHHDYVHFARAARALLRPPRA
jgi:hypothetical protein